MSLPQLQLHSPAVQENSGGFVVDTWTRREREMDIREIEAQKTIKINQVQYSERLEEVTHHHHEHLKHDADDCDVL